MAEAARYCTFSVVISGIELNSPMLPNLHHKPRIDHKFQTLPIRVVLRLCSVKKYHTSAKNPSPFLGFTIAKYFVNGAFNFDLFKSIALLMVLFSPTSVRMAMSVSSSYFLWPSSPALAISC